MANFDKTDDYTLHKLLNTFEKFSIPNFQRAYDWSNKQIVDLWSSLESVEEDKYFLGNIVCVKPSKEEEENRLQIIDGQQRLTTLSLMLMAIRDTYKNLPNIKDPELKKYASQAPKRIDKYLNGTDTEDPDEIFTRLKLSKPQYQEVFNDLIAEDQDLFDNNFNNEKYKSLDNQSKRYVKNYKILKKLLSDLVDESGPRGLKDFEQKVKSVQFIVIVCESENDVYRIFEGLNSTGLGLSVADLVKNSILQATTNKDVREQVEYDWSELENNFDKTSRELFPKFMRHHWISSHSYISISNLFLAVKKQYIVGKDTSEIQNYVDSLGNESLWYLGLRYSDYGNHLKIFHTSQDVLKKFKKLGRFDQANSVILSYLRMNKNNNKLMTNKLLKNSLEQLWRFMFRARFVSVSPSRYEKKFAKHCENLLSINKIEDLESELNRFRKDIKEDVSDSSQVIAGLAELDYQKDSALITLVLNDLMVKKGPKSHRHKKDSIEHILPQEPEKHWNLKKKDVAGYVEKLGNLTLLDSETENPRAGNRGFSYKLENIFTKSPFNLNKEIKNWEKDFLSNPEEAIQQRGEKIATEIEKLLSIK